MSVHYSEVACLIDVHELNLQAVFRSIGEWPAFV